MVTLKTPTAPATKKQLWLLHILTKEDTRGWELTMQEASDKIQELKSAPIKTTAHNGFHYCLMYSSAPSTHRMSNGQRKWKSFYTTKNKAMATKQYNAELARMERTPSLYPTSQVVLVECTRAALAKVMLQKGLTELRALHSGTLFARIVKDSR